MNGRHDALVYCLSALRRARTALRLGRIGETVELMRQAQGWLSFADGAYPWSFDCTAGLRRALFRLERRISKAVDGREVPAAELVAVLAESLTVLRTRDGIEISDTQIWERARNAATALLGVYVIRDTALSTNGQQRP